MATKKIQKIRDRLECGIKASGLTDRQSEVLTYILQCWMSGFIPTYREICTQFGYRSTHAAVGHTVALEREGYLEAEEGISGLILSDKSLNLALTGTKE